MELIKIFQILSFLVRDSNLNLQMITLLVARRGSLLV